ncbi:hypothetical protein D1AOALGA4SA_7596 [Olavius algarvensis Delta 1 endosymbiont]|nr:hypothetical protein D1AOALGA4SA_7596 [Olavius algarvensis Delta 1 endosymbiont]
MTKSSKLLTYRHADSIKLECEIDLRQLFDTKEERERFEKKWDAFLESDPNNPDILKKSGNRLHYLSEQLIPEKQDHRPTLLLILGNPASHSVTNGMFFSFEGDRTEHRFWKDILKRSGALKLSYDKDLPVDQLNEIRKTQLLDLDYHSPYRVGLCVFITLPSAPGGSWGGVAGVQKLIGVRALRKLEREESTRVLKLAKKFNNSKGAVIAFQKNAWNSLRSENDSEYSIEAARAGNLIGTLKGQKDSSLFCVPPTRLAGPCRGVLTKMLKNMEAWT